jgi:hypothetical protein
VTPETAQILLVAIVAVASIVWMIGLRFLFVSYRVGKPVPSDGLSPMTEGSLTGSAEVDGRAEVLATKAASLLAKGGVFAFGPIKITEKTADRIAFERLGPEAGNQNPAGWFRQGELHFTQVRQGRSRVEWAVELSSRAWLLWLGGLFQVLSLIALVVGGWAMYTFVVSSPEPAIRWQTVQMLQVVHFLWPPFLMGLLYRRGMRAVAIQFEALANNLPYYGE